MAIDSLPPQGAPPFLLSKPVPAVLRGRLHHVVAGVAFDDFRRAICAWSAVDALVDRRRELQLELAGVTAARDEAIRQLGTVQKFEAASRQGGAS